MTDHLKNQFMKDLDTVVLEMRKHFYGLDLDQQAVAKLMAELQENRRCFNDLDDDIDSLLAESEKDQ